VSGALLRPESDLDSDQILDLIPVRLLAELEPMVHETMRAKLTQLITKPRLGESALKHAY